MSGEIAQSSLALMLFLSVLFGFVAALAYDVFRIRRIAINIPILPHFEDFLFMIACAAVMSVIFFAQSSGRVRAFAFFGALGGFYIYRKTLGRLVMGAADKIIRLVKYLFGKIVMPPIRLVRRILKRLGRMLEKFFRALMLKIRKKKTDRLLCEFVNEASYGFGDKKYKRKPRKRGKKREKK